MIEADEKFFAWLDTELSGDEAAEMAARVAADPHLRTLAEQHRAMQARLKGAFDSVAEAPLPERFQASVRPSAEVIDFGSRKRTRMMPSLPQWAAIAATLVIGVIVGTMVPHAASAPVEVQGGQLYAAAALNRDLDTELASAPGGSTRIGLTFRDQSGAICRSFTQSATSGLACRQDGRWRLRGLFAAPEGQGNAYRMAAGMDPNLAALVDSTMAGAPFNATQEKSAKNRGWR